MKDQWKRMPNKDLMKQSGKPSITGLTRHEMTRMVNEKMAKYWREKYQEEGEKENQW